MIEAISIVLGLFCAVIFVAHAVDAYLAPWSAAFLILADLNSSAQLVKLTEMKKPRKSLAKGDCNWASGFRPANRALKLNCRFTVPQLQNESAEVSDPR